MQLCPLKKYLMALVFILTASGNVKGQIWSEIDDAGSLPGTSQRTRGTDTLEFIQGNIEMDNVVDMYCIQITDPANFSAWTDESGGGSAEFNTMLWLFNEDGIGVLANDDNPLDIIPFHSGIFPPSDDGVTSVEMDGPGNYYLAISQYWNIPHSPNGRIFSFAKQEVNSGPDGPGGGLPVSHWLEQGVGEDAPTGAYSIHLNGAQFCRTCQLAPPFWGNVGEGLSGSVFALHTFDDGTGNYLYAGGNFDTSGGNTVNNIATWDGASWSALDNGVEGVVTSMATFQDQLFVGGDFIIGDPTLRQTDIVRWDGTMWRSVSSMYSLQRIGVRDGVGTTRVATMLSLDLENRKLRNGCNDTGGPLLYVGGEFDVYVEGLIENFPIGVNLAVRTETEWCEVGGAEFNGAVKSLAAFDDGGGVALYVGGGFTVICDAFNTKRFDPIPVSGVARWDGQNWTALGVGIGPQGVNPPSTVFALTQYFNDNSGGPILVAAGSFDTAGGVTVNGIAKWDGSTWNALGGGIPEQYLPATPFSLHVFDDDGRGPDLYVGGVFTIDGDVRPGVLKWDSIQWSEVGLGVEGLVYAMTSAEFGDLNAVYMGGSFAEAGGQTLNNISTWGSTYLGDVHWVSNNSGLWDEAPRWSTNPQLPAQNDDVCIDRSQANPTVTHSSGDTRINSLFCSEQLVVDGGTFGVAKPSESWNLDLRGGAIVGSSVLTSRGVFVWTDGEIGENGAANPMTIIAAENAVIEPVPGADPVLYGQLELNGLTFWRNTGDIWAGADAFDSTLTNTSTGEFEIRTDADLNRNGVSTPIFINHGIVSKFSGESDGLTDIDAFYQNAGTTVVHSGTLLFRQGGTHTGSFEIAKGATLWLVNSEIPRHTLEAGSSITGAGRSVLGPGFVDILDGVNYHITGTTEIRQFSRVFFNDPNCTTFALDHLGGNIAGTGTLTVNGPAVWSGGWIGREEDGPITVVMNDTLSIESGPEKLVDGILEINGHATMNYWLTVTGRGEIRTAPTATFAIQSDDDINGSVFQYGSLGLFDNAGTLTKVAGILDGFTEINVVFQNTGTVRIDSGTLRFMDTFTQTAGTTILNGGTLRVEFNPLELLGGTLMGSGTILSNVNNAATLEPGMPIGQIDLIGNYTQFTLGTLAVDIGGSAACTENDKLVLTNHASIVGTLEIQLLDDCTPTPGQTFTIMTFASMDGAFDTINNRCAGAGLIFEINYGTNEIALEVVEQPAPNGDLDFNGSIDLRDIALFQSCFAGENGIVDPCCEQANLNENTTIDLDDYSLLIDLLVGP